VILNAYAVLDAAISLLRFGLVLPIIWLALVGWVRWRRSVRDPNKRDVLENRFYLLFLLAGLLLVLNVLAWPLFYLLLQSYVAEWPGVMCIYGVTRVGAGTVGPSRHLPVLLEVLQTTKPLLVFLSGAWFVLYLINQRAQTAPLMGRVLLGVLATGLLAGVDATAELTYLLIPKKEEFLASGCCTAVFDRENGPGRLIPSGLLGEVTPGRLSATFFVANVGLVVALFGSARAGRKRPVTARLAPLLGVTVLILILNWVYVVEVVAPRVLHAPGHHCPYDLVAQAPPSAVAIALFAVSGFCVGWGGCITWLGRGPESGPHVDGLLVSLLDLAAFGFAAAVLLLAVELVVA
jgi:hypothetical protein